MKEGLIWRVGDGSTINIWSDPWLPRDHTRKPLTPRGQSLLTRVEELINPISGEWDEQLVRDTFWPEDAEVILSIPIGHGGNDWPAWHFDSRGLFSVKSAYKLAVQCRDRDRMRDTTASTVGSSRSGDFPWHRIWQLRLPRKIQMFLWRLAHNSLPVKQNLRRRKVDTGTLCPVCRRYDEDCGHLFFKSKVARLVGKC